MANPLTDEEIKVMEMMGFFFYSMGLNERAQRTAKAILAIDPNNNWALRTLTALKFKDGNYQEVLDLTFALSLENCQSNEDKEMLKLKARALYKLGKVLEAQTLMQNINNKEI